MQLTDGATDAYRDFLAKKSQHNVGSGFEPVWMPDCLFDFQRHLVEWAIRRGRAAIFASCGLGKTLMELVWAENVARKADRPVLILTPLAVSSQTVREGAKFGVTCTRSRDGQLARSDRIVVTNYERLHHFNPEEFAGVVCDESSILKAFTGATRKRITRFVSKMPYRLLATATPSPNDYTELGTSSEALGELSYSDMLRRFFAQLDDKGQKRELRKQREAEEVIAADPSYYKKLAFRVSQTIGQWRLRHHAVTDFWRWVASWARACRLPSDLGFSDKEFLLPPLVETCHIVAAKTPPPGFLFYTPAIGMREERQERKRTLEERCAFVADLVKHDRPAVVWCHANGEADRLVEVIPGAEQVAGRTPDDRKEELYSAFESGSLRVLVLKPKIGAWGLNWQHCNHVVAFPSHSYEQHHQLISRCWRFGQKLPVNLDVVATEGEVRVLENLRSKASRADAMFAAMTREMSEATRIDRENLYTAQVRKPQWL